MSINFVNNLAANLFYISDRNFLNSMTPLQRKITAITLVIFAVFACLGFYVFRKKRHKNIKKVDKLQAKPILNPTILPQDPKKQNQTSVPSSTKQNKPSIQLASNLQQNFCDPQPKSQQKQFNFLEASFMSHPLRIEIIETYLKEGGSPEDFMHQLYQEEKEELSQEAHLCPLWAAISNLMQTDAQLTSLNKEKIREYLQEYAHRRNIQTLEELLSTTIQKGSLELVTLLLKITNRNILLTAEKISPLLLALQEKRNEIASLLINEGATNGSERLENGDTALQLAIRNQLDQDIIIKLIDNTALGVCNFSHNEQEEIVLLAVETKQWEVFKVLLKKGIKVDNKLLHILLKQNPPHYEACLNALKLGRVNPNARHLETKEIPLELIKDNFAFIQLLVEYGAKLNEDFADGKTNFQQYCINTHPDFLQKLEIQNCQEPQEVEQVEEALWRIENPIIKIKPLHEIFQDCQKILKENKNEIPENLKNQFQLCEKLNRDQLIQLLQEAIFQANEEAVTYICSILGERINKVLPTLAKEIPYEQTPLMAAMRLPRPKNIAIVKILLDQEKIDLKLAPKGWTPLMLAAHLLDADLIDLLINKKVDLNPDLNAWNYTPLEEVLRENRLDLAEKLILAGADSYHHIQIDEKETALHLAFKKNLSADLICKLIENGANLNAADKDGLTPAQLIQNLDRSTALAKKLIEKEILKPEN